MNQLELHDNGPEALVEYSVGGDVWRCNQFALLAAEMAGPGGRSIKKGELPQFHEALCLRERSWLIVRRLFGMCPVLPSPDMPLDDLKVWGRQELQESLGITAAQLQKELEAVRGIWIALQPPAAREAKPEKKTFKPELEFAEDGLLAQQGFGDLRFERMEDRAWFAGRVRDFEKLLQERMTAGLARNTLITEWQLRALDAFLANPDKAKVGSADYRSNMKTRQDLDAAYTRQLDQINKLAPWASAIIGKYSFAGVLSDLTRAIQEYHAKGETRLIDGMFTALEIQVECRRSAQAPEPRYRAGLVTYVNAAKAGLWDPRWQSPFTPADLKKVDGAWRAAARAIGDESGEPVPDLEKDGPEGEYAPLTLPSAP